MTIYYKGKKIEIINGQYVIKDLPGCPVLTFEAAKTVINKFEVVSMKASLRK